MTTKQPQPKRKRGAQPGNLNALKHGFYSAVLPHAQQERFRVALSMAPDELTREIALLRQRLERLLDAEPDNIELLSQAMTRLARLCATHYHMRGSDADRLTAAMSNILQDIERTLGA